MIYLRKKNAMNFAVLHANRVTTMSVALTIKRCHQYQNSVTKIQNLSPTTLCHHHHQPIGIHYNG